MFSCYIWPLLKSKLNVLLLNYVKNKGHCWELPCLVSEAVTPMVKAESETLGPKPLRRQSLSPWQGATSAHFTKVPAWP